KKREFESLISWQGDPVAGQAGGGCRPKARRFSATSAACSPAAALPALACGTALVQIPREAAPGFLRNIADAAARRADGRADALRPYVEHAASLAQGQRSAGLAEVYGNPRRDFHFLVDPDSHVPLTA